MNLTILILLALALTVSSNPGTDFDFYTFASEWAGATCRHEKCKAADDFDVSTTFWNIHGLWPSDGNEDLTYCTQEKFNPLEIVSLKAEMLQYWSGLFNSAEVFHSHEWEKHGTCSNMKQVDFFSTGLQVAKSVDMYNNLAKNNITPGNSYTCEQFANVIQQTFGVSSFTLTKSSGDISGFMLCISKDLKVQDCPKADICSGDANYPNFVPQKDGPKAFLASI